jgi:hypothetical protein
MKKTLLSLVTGLALVTPAFAGSDVAPAEVAPAPSMDLFRAHEWNVDVSPVYSIKVGGGDDNNDKDGFGGALSLSYYFTRVVGLRLDTSVVESNGALGLVGADLLLRAPIDSARIAPYGVLGGGAEVFKGGADYYLRAGGGIEFRFTEKVGVFAEGTYNWIDKNVDRVLVKVGVRFAF